MQSAHMEQRTDSAADEAQSRAHIPIVHLGRAGWRAWNRSEPLDTPSRRTVDKSSVSSAASFLCAAETDA